MSQEGERVLLVCSVPPVGRRSVAGGWDEVLLVCSVPPAGRSSVAGG